MRLNMTSVNAKGGKGACKGVWLVKERLGGVGLRQGAESGVGRPGREAGTGWGDESEVGVGG